MPSSYLNQTQFIQFGAAGTQNIVPTVGYSILVRFVDLFANGVTVTITIGTETILSGVVNIAPAQMNFGSGRGSGVINDPIIVTVTGACTVLIGYTEIQP